MLHPYGSNYKEPSARSRVKAPNKNEVLKADYAKIKETEKLIVNLI